MSLQRLFSLPSRPLARCAQSTRNGLSIRERLGQLQFEQRRGKKMGRKMVTIPVRLTRDVTAFGPKDAIIPVRRGTMRNVLYPLGKAEYVTIPELRALGMERKSLERRSAFKAVTWKERRLAARTADTAAAEENENAFSAEPKMESKSAATNTVAQSSTNA